QILASGTIRAAGWVRALLYSGSFVRYWEFGRSEREISQFLMHYMGGGTVFPFGVLEESLRECAAVQPIRVIITDRDFEANYCEKPAHARIFGEAADRSTPLVLLLHQPDPEAARRYRQAGARVVGVNELEDFPRMAAELTRALFAEVHS